MAGPAVCGTCLFCESWNGVEQADLTLTLQISLTYLVIYSVIYLAAVELEVAEAMAL